jgi:probable addiction module antidote protein
MTFYADLLESLKDPAEAQGYLEAALKDGDPALFLEALKDVAEAQGGMSAMARRTRLHRTGLYRFFSPKGNPTYKNLMTVVRALGFRFRLERMPKTRRLTHP